MSSHPWSACYKTWRWQKLRERQVHTSGPSRFTPSLPCYRDRVRPLALLMRFYYAVLDPVIVAQRYDMQGKWPGCHANDAGFTRLPRCSGPEPPAAREVFGQPVQDPPCPNASAIACVPLRWRTTFTTCTRLKLRWPCVVAAPYWRVALWWGVFIDTPGHRNGPLETTERLVGYIKLPRSGELVHYLDLIGHRDHLAGGVMHVYACAHRPMATER
ncbi:Uncharacterised protein [Achromobacter spanius]|nr:hypothetical protein LMG5911_05203 [Achromobacter spanius]SPT40906.1 Uncharacterised protein [Achromobacter denitrificans]VEE55149.1 Uncharacterised protein [Achromobacter spanius]